LNEAFDKLEQQPYYYFKINGKYRKIVIPSFPYMVVYRIEEQTVIVIAVFHQKKHPKKLETRF
jgi:plasmid stabilization system protein ParE